MFTSVYIKQHAVSQNCFYKNLLFLHDIIPLAHAFSMEGGGFLEQLYHHMDAQREFL
jgi:hypothetical protein